jgi:UDP:flavonoid glycosyltransferase YjiC (YdhE family)
MSGCADVAEAGAAVAMLKRKHVAVFSVAQTGHINPTLPVVQSLVARDCKVTYFLTSPQHAAAVSAAGAEHVVVPPLSTSALASRPSVLDLASAAIDALPWIVGALRALEPVVDVVVHDVLAKWGAWAAHVLGVPAVCSCTTFVLDDGDLCSVNAKPTDEHTIALSTLASR